MAIISSSKVYDIVKFVTIVVLPALLTFYGLIASTLGLPHTTEILTIGAGLVTFLGTLVGISSSQYKAEKK